MWKLKGRGKLYIWPRVSNLKKKVLNEENKQMNLLRNVFLFSVIKGSGEYLKLCV